MSPSEPVPPSSPQQNGHSSPVQLDIAHSADMASDATSGPAEPDAPVDHPSAARYENEAHDRQENGYKDEEMSDAQDEDAEGEEDADYSVEYAASQHSQRLPQAASSPSDSGSSRKRKASMDENELMALNPELYGLRRSVRRICCRTY